MNGCVADPGVGILCDDDAVIEIGTAIFKGEYRNGELVEVRIERDNFLAGCIVNDNRSNGVLLEALRGICEMLRNL